MPERIGGWLFAAVEMERLPGLGRNFRGEPVQMHFGKVCLVLALFIGMALVCWMLSRLFDRQPSQRTYFSRRSLFRELCRAHQLDRADCGLLRLLARRNRLTHPATVFLRPELFQPGAIASWLRGKEYRLALLQAKLFAGMVDGDEPAGFSAGTGHSSRLVAASLPCQPG